MMTGIISAANRRGVRPSWHDESDPELDAFRTFGIPVVDLW
jgi:hypothetical protein